MKKCFQKNHPHPILDRNAHRRANMTKRSIAAAAIFAALCVAASARTPMTVSVFPFIATGETAKNGNAFHAKLVEEIKAQFAEGSRALPDLPPLPGPPDDPASARALVSAAPSPRTDFIVAGVEEMKNEGLSVTACLIATRKGEPVYRSSLFIPKGADQARSASIIAGRMRLFTERRLPVPAEDAGARPDTNGGRIVISWKTDPAQGPFAVFRSYSERGPFQIIADGITAGTYEDSSIVPGVEYHYGVTGTSDGIPGDTASPVKCHLPAPMPKGASMAQLEKAKTVSEAALSRRKKDPTVRAHIKFLEKHYMHPIKLSLALFMSKPYIDSGALVPLTGFDGFQADEEAREILLTRSDYSCCVMLKSGKLFSILEEAKSSGIPDFEGLTRTIIENAVAYAMPAGEREFTDDEGRVRHVPLFAAFGMSSEYFRNYRNWRSNTLMVGTSDSELKKKMKEAQENFNSKSR